jgi:hypothetical protein
MRQRHHFVFLGAALAPLVLSLPSRATVLDAFETTTGWTSVADSAGSTVTVSTTDGISGNALHLDYSLAVGNYAGVYKTGFDSSDLAVLGANALKFKYRATGDTNTVEIKFVDADSPTTILADHLVYKFDPIADNSWREVTVPLTDFYTSTNGTGVFDLSHVGKFGFGVSRSVDGVAGEGSLFVDDFRLADVSNPTSIIDFSEGSSTAVNDRAGSQAIYFGAISGASGSYVSVSTVSHSGAKSREFSCAVGGGFCFVAEEFGGMTARGDETIEFWVRGVVGGEPLSVELKSQNPAMSASLPVAGIPAGSFAKKSFSLDSFKAINPNLDLSALKEFVFVFNDTGGNHKIYLDDIALVGPSKTTEVLLHSVEEFPLHFESSYEASAPTATATVGLLGEVDSSVPGHSGVANPVARLDYTFTFAPGLAFAVAERHLGANFLLEPSVQFRYKGTGANSDIEVKLKDSDGTVYRKVLSDASDTSGAWKNVKIPIDQFSFSVLGDDANLNLVRVPQVEFILSRGEAAAGTFSVDTLESFSPPDMEKGSVGHVLSNVTTPDNPFSPNGDGVKDLFRVDYSLSEPATVVLKVYNLQGVVVKTIDKGTQSAGSSELTWEGIGDNGVLVSNGLYFFVLEADSVLSGKDFFRQIVGVMR